MDDRVSSPVSYVEPPGIDTPYPPIAEDANDLRQLKKAVEDAASVSGGLWLSYLFVLFYLAVAAGAVTQVDLFFEHPVKLPFLNIELPLLAFFFLAPILFLLTHVYTLVHFVLLTDKAKRFHAELRKQIKSGAGRSNSEAAEIRNALRLQLPSNIFVQFLAGPEDLRESFFGALLKSIAWATLVIGPILLILLLQVQFLPYHNEIITRTHRLALLIDLVFLWWLWRTILSGRGDFHRWRSWTSWAAPTLGIGLTLVVIFFSLAIATFPGEWQENRLPAFGRGYFSSTLVLTGLNLYEGLNIDEPKKVEWRQFLFRARGRDLKGVIFDLAVLPKIDFTNAQLQGASFDGTQLQGASLEGAHLEGATLNNSQLQGASLVGAHLEGATLNNSQLQGASLEGTWLQRASLFHTQLQGVKLESVHLQGAMLVKAQMQGASLRNAQLQGALLPNAELQGATLEGVHLEGASLPQAILQGALVTKAHLEGARLEEAQLQGAVIEYTDLSSADLSGAFIWRATAVFVVLDSVRLSSKPLNTPIAAGSEFAPNVPWTNDTFQILKGKIMGVPPGPSRELALQRVRRLDCASNDGNLPPCNRLSGADSNGSTTLQDLLETVQPKKVADYEKALAKRLQDLVCRKDDASIDILRGLLRNGRLRATGSQAPTLVDYVMSKNCPVSAFLTSVDRGKLFDVKS